MPTISTIALDEILGIGAAVSQRSEKYQPVAIAGRRFTTDPTKSTRRILEVLRDPVEQSKEPAESSLTIEGLWRRGQVDFQYGAGQEWLDDVNSSVPPMRERFRTSYGVDCWTTRQLGLLPQVGNQLPGSGSNSLLLAAGPVMYNVRSLPVSYLVYNGTLWNNVTGVPATACTGMAYDGRYVYLACGASGVYRVDTLGTTTAASSWSAQAADGIAFVGGRLICWTGASIGELSSAGVFTLLQTMPIPAFTWACVCEAPNGIYAAGNGGGHGLFFHIGVDSGTAGLTKPTPAGALQPGDTVNCILFDAGVIVCGSSQGICLLRVGNSFGTGDLLTKGATIAIPNGVACLDGWSDFVWFGWGTGFTFTYAGPDGVMVSDTSRTGLGRLRLSRFTIPDAIVPAYASDLMAGSPASPKFGRVSSTVRFGGRRWFTVDNDGIYREDITGALVTDAMLCTGKFGYGTTEDKIAVSAEVAHDQLPAGATIGCAMVTEAGRYQSFVTSTVVGTTISPVSSAQAQRHSWAEVQITMTRATVTSAPVELRRWTVMSIPAPRRIEEIIVAVICKSRVATGLGSGSGVGRDPLDDFEFLRTLCMDRTPITYQEGVRVDVVIPDRTEVQPESWQSNNAWYEGMVMLRMLTVEVN